MLDAVRRALPDERAWIVGGAVRDRLLGRATAEDDLDLVVAADPRPLARRLASATRAAAFELSDEFGGGRVVGPGGGWQGGLAPLHGGAPHPDPRARRPTPHPMARPPPGGGR